MPRNRQVPAALSILLLLLSVFAVASAQTTGEDLTQTVALNETVTFRVPESWVTLADQGQITLATSLAVIETVGEARPVPAGELFAVAFGGPLLDVLELEDGDTVALARAMAQQLSGDPALAVAPAESLVVGEREAARITWAFVEGQSPLDAGVIVVEVQADYHVVFWYVANTIDFGPYSQTMEAVAGTLETGGVLAPELTPEPTPPPLAARDLMQRVTSPRGDLMLFLPESWVSAEDEGQLYVATSEVALDSLVTAGAVLPPGGLAAIVLDGPLALGLRVEESPEAVVATLAEDILASLETQVISDVFSFDAADTGDSAEAGDAADAGLALPGAFQVWGYTLGGDLYSQGVLTVQIAPGDYVVFVFTARIADPTPYLAALQSIAGAALRLDAPAATLTPVPTTTG